MLRAVHALDAATLGDGALLPADDDGSDLRQRLELAFADLVDVLERTPDAWTQGRLFVVVNSSRTRAREERPGRLYLSTCRA